MTEENGMHWADIRAVLMKKGVTQSQIANEENVTEACVSMVIKRNRTSAKVALAIAAHTELSLKTLFGRRYQYAIKKFDEKQRKPIASTQSIAQ